MAFCKVCHKAFDENEWDFYPEDMSEWISILKQKPESRREMNSWRDIMFHRILVQPSPRSNAYADEHYRSAFVNEPVKLWKGEPGVQLIRGHGRVMPVISKRDEHYSVMKTLQTLRETWVDFEDECTVENCRLCILTKPEENDMQEIDEDEILNEDQDIDEELLDENDGRDQDPDYNPGYDGVCDIENGRSTTNHRKPLEIKGYSKISTKDHSRTSALGPHRPWNVKFIARPVKRLIQGRKALPAWPKRPGRERDWLNSRPYDESIPYSHQYGYTYATYTSNDWIASWRDRRETVVGC